MKLEEKHIIPYSPYKVKVSCGESRGLDRELTHDYFDDEKVCITAVLNSDNCKLILRPLSDLTKLEEQIQQNYPCDLIFRYYDSGENNLTMSVTYKMMGDAFTDILINRNSIDNSPYWFVCFCLENHLDVFNLIPNNLAIDVNTLTNE